MEWVGVNYGCGLRLLDHCVNCDTRDLFNLGLAENEIGSVDHKAFLRHDAAKALPFEDDSIEFVFSEHFIEHVSLKTAIGWLKEVYRVLRPGGIIRVSTPDLKKYCSAYEKNSLEELTSHLGNHLLFVPKRRAWAINQIFYYWDHAWLYDEEELTYAACRAGFLKDSIHFRSFGEGDARVRGMDSEERKEISLYVELTKP